MQFYAIIEASLQNSTGHPLLDQTIWAITLNRTYFRILVHCLTMAQIIWSIGPGRPVEFCKDIQMA